MVSLADAGAGTEGVSDLADAGMALPADHAGVGTVGVSVLANAGMAFPADFAGVATVGVASLADVGMRFPADLAGVVTVGVAPMAVGGMTLQADHAGEVTIGVADRTEVVGVLKSSSGVIGWDDRVLPGNGRHAWTPSQQDVRLVGEPESPVRERSSGAGRVRLGQAGYE